MSTCLSKTDLPKTKTLALSETKTQSRSLRSLAATTTDPSQPWALLSDSRVCPQVCIALYTTRRRSKPLDVKHGVRFASVLLAVDVCIPRATL